MAVMAVFNSMVLKEQSFNQVVSAEKSLLKFLKVLWFDVN